MQALEIDHEETLEAMREFNDADSARASDAGETRQKIGEFLDATGINNKAFAFCRMVLRMKKDEKRQDCLRSIEALLPILKAEIAANGTQDAFDTPAAARDMANAQVAEEDPADVDGDIDEDNDDRSGEDDGELAAESGAFAAAAEEVYPAKVTPMRGRR